MSAHCCTPPKPQAQAKQTHDHDGHAHAEGDPQDPRWRRALWIALAVNAAMFATEIAAGIASGSVSLLADAVDFAGDAANYALSLAVLGLAAVWHSRAALLKGWSMLAYGAAVLGRAGWLALAGTVPEAATMGAVGALAFAANLGVAAVLWRFRSGDANMRSVWICTRNDALGNLAVMLAALGVLGTGTRWPDLAVAAVMAALAISGGIAVVRQARAELRTRSW
jgi:Co/Zn/Cd efflux system component